MPAPGRPFVTRSVRAGRVLLRVRGRIFAVRVGPCLVVSLSPARAAALVRAGLACRLDAGEDSLLPGWVVLAPASAGSWQRLAHEACEHACGASMNPAPPAGHTAAPRATGGTMAAPFVWFELGTTDQAGTQAFYRDLLRWDIQGEDGGPAMVAGADGPWAAVAQADGGGSGWIPYVQVDDVAAATERAASLGATVVRPKAAGPAGEFSVIADPAGARIALWQPAGA